MRVISGTAKGKKLIAPEGLHTRPVTDQIKEALFNIWQFDIAGSDFLDLFSGSGSMGIEAISRGAANVIMVDNDTNAVNVINTNLKACRFDTKNYQVMKADVFNVIRQLDANGRQFDIIYLDPPFTVDEIFIPVMEAIDASHILKEDGCLGIRTIKQKEMPETFTTLEKTRVRKYGISNVHFYRVKRD